MDLIYFLIIGVIAGWLAGVIMNTPDKGLVHDMLMGILGAVVGGLLFGLLGFKAVSLVGKMITATVGAIVCIFVLRKLKSRRL